jgi:hypothetical protein
LPPANICFANITLRRKKLAGASVLSRPVQSTTPPPFRAQRYCNGNAQIAKLHG